jgi:heme/copper-type cytochrome/quinol oxidase subunit 2
MFAWHDSIWMWLSMIVFWILVIGLAYYGLVALLRDRTNDTDPHGRRR